MNKQAYLENVYNSAFNDEFKKIAGEVKIPEGGLRMGLIASDLTKLMTPEDAKRVKKKKSVFWFSPGLLPSAAIGAMSGGSIHWGLSDLRRMIKNRPMSNSILPYKAKGAIIGAIGLPTLLYGLTRSGISNKQALKYAKKLVDETR